MFGTNLPPLLKKAEVYANSNVQGHGYRSIQGAAEQPEPQQRLLARTLADRPYRPTSSFQC